MTITQIECFVETAKMKSLSKAAANMFVSQPAISRQIKALETELGFSLFERKNFGVSLTPTGKILYGEWEEMLLAHRSAIDKAKDLYFGEQKNIRIGIHEPVANKERITNALIRYNQKYPDLDVEYDFLQMWNLKDGIEQGKLHMIITYLSEIRREQALNMLYMDEFMMPTGIICSRCHPLSRRKRLDMSDIYGETLGILSEEASLDHKERTIKLLQKNNLFGQVELKEFSSWHNLQIALITGKYITIMYEGIMAGMEDDLIFYPFELGMDISKIVIAWKDDKYAIKARNIAQIYQ